MITLSNKNLIIEAIQNKIHISSIVISDSVNKKTIDDLLSLAHSNKIPISVQKKTHNQSLTSPIYATTDDSLYKDFNWLKNHMPAILAKPFFLILDHIQDPHNFGAIIRSAVVFGVTAIIYPKDRACPINDTVVKVSAGSIFHIPLIRVTNINQTIHSLKEMGCMIIGSDSHGTHSKISSISANDSLALVIGSEGDGISSLTKKSCDFMITIPQKHAFDSLNASVAAGILLYMLGHDRGLH